MLKRTMVAVIGVPLLILVFSFAPAWATMLLVAVLCAIGAYELMHAVAGESGKRLGPVTVLVAALVPLDLFLSGSPMPESMAQEQLSRAAGSVLGVYNLLAGLPAEPSLSLLPLLALLFTFLLFGYAIVHYGTDRALSFAEITAALFAGLGFPLMLSCLLRLRLLPEGAILVFLPIAISFGSDTFAYFGGMLFGRHKLTPVSPKKTVEGSVGGVIGGIIGLLLLQGIAALGGVLLLRWWEILLFGVLGSAVSQIGDLSFSVIKREFGVKDYGKLLPGHGGVLDRFDSVTFVAPAVYLLCVML